jgi:hypothetical protein
VPHRRPAQAPMRALISGAFRPSRACPMIWARRTRPALRCATAPSVPASPSLPRSPHAREGPWQGSASGRQDPLVSPSPKSLKQVAGCATSTTLAGRMELVLAGSAV